jgi:hemerythrin
MEIHPRSYDNCVEPIDQNSVNVHKKPHDTFAKNVGDKAQATQETRR